MLNAEMLNSDQMPRAKQLTMKLKMPPRMAICMVGTGHTGNTGNPGTPGRFKVAKLCKAGSCAGHFLVLRPFVPLLWPKRRKEVPERARAPQEKLESPRGEATKREGSQVTRLDGGSSENGTQTNPT